MSIRQFFKARAENRRASKILEAKVIVALEAVDKGNTAEALLVIDSIKEQGAVTAVPRLVRAAIREDNLEVFNKLFEGGTRNFWFDSYNSGGAGSGISFTTHEHVLHAAIEAGSAKIALSLAKDLHVATDNSGYSETVIYGVATPSGMDRKREPYTPPLALAEKKGMSAVAAALAERQATLLMARAKAARSKIKPSRPA